MGWGVGGWGIVWVFLFFFRLEFQQPGFRQISEMRGMLKCDDREEWYLKNVLWARLCASDVNAAAENQQMFPHTQTHKRSDDMNMR